MGLNPGDKVLIRTYDKKPGLWDDSGEMFGLMGTVHIIERLAGLYYKLSGVDWSWREEDLIPLEEGRVDPNTAFQIKRNKKS